jgi:hypothetical protein
MPNFGHSEVLIKMTHETHLLLVPRDRLVILKRFNRKFFVDLPSREDWSMGYADGFLTERLLYSRLQKVASGEFGSSHSLSFYCQEN